MATLDDELEAAKKARRAANRRIRAVAAKQRAEVDQRIVDAVRKAFPDGEDAVGKAARSAYADLVGDGLVAAPPKPGTDGPVEVAAQPAAEAGDGAAYGGFGGRA